MGRAPCHGGYFPVLSPSMSSREKFVAEVEAFLTRTGMSARAFGIAALNDGRFVARLRDGGDVRLETADRVRRFMEAHERRPGKSQAHSDGLAVAQ